MVLSVHPSVHPSWHGKNFNVGHYTHTFELKFVIAYSDLYGLISFKLGIVIETIKLNTLISVWMILTFIQGHICMENKKKLVSYLSQM